MTSRALAMKYGWRTEPFYPGYDWRKSSRWSLQREDNVHNLTLPSDRVLKKLYRQVFPEGNSQLFRVRARQPWGCIVETAKGISKAKRKLFLLKVAEHFKTRTP
jgi:hypothetical protein